MKCLIIDIVDSVIETELSRYMQVDTVPVPNSAELAGMIPGYDILVMRVVPGITREVLDAADSLKMCIRDRYSGVSGAGRSQPQRG